MAKRRHRRVTMCGIEGFEKSSTFIRKFFDKHHQKIVSISAKRLQSAVPTRSNIFVNPSVNLLMFM